MLSFSRALNEELKGRGIAVTAVCPGPVRTEFFGIAEETGEVALYKKLFLANPVKVVKKAFRDSLRRRSVSVYGGTMNGFYWLCKLLPHSWLLRFL